MASESFCLYGKMDVSRARLPADILGILVGSIIGYTLFILISRAMS